VPWLDILLVVCLLQGAMTWALWRSDVGQRLVAEQQAEIVKLARARLSAAQFQDVIQQLQEPSSPLRRAIAVCTRTAIWTFVSAWLCYVILPVLFLRSDIGYVRILSIASHAAPAWLVGQMFLALLTFITGSTYATGSLPQLLPFVAFPAPETWLGLLLARYDVFALWWAAVVGVGLAYVFHRPWWTFTAVFAAIPIVLTILQASVSLGGAPGGLHGLPAAH